MRRAAWGAPAGERHRRGDRRGGRKAPGVPPWCRRRDHQQTQTECPAVRGLAGCGHRAGRARRAAAGAGARTEESSEPLPTCTGGGRAPPSTPSGVHMPVASAPPPGIVAPAARSPTAPGAASAPAGESARGASGEPLSPPDATSSSWFSGRLGAESRSNSAASLAASAAVLAAFSGRSARPSTPRTRARNSARCAASSSSSAHSCLRACASRPSRPCAARSRCSHSPTPPAACTSSAMSAAAAAMPCAMGTCCSASGVTASAGSLMEGAYTPAVGLVPPAAPASSHSRAGSAQLLGPTVFATGGDRAAPPLRAAGPSGLSGGASRRERASSSSMRFARSSLGMSAWAVRRGMGAQLESSLRTRLGAAEDDGQWRRRGQQMTQ